MMTRMSLIAVLERDERITLDESHPVWDAALRLIVDAQRETLDGILDEPAKPPSVIARHKPKKPRNPAPSDEAVLAAVEGDPGQTAGSLADGFGCEGAAISAALIRLRRAGRIYATGTHRGKRYYKSKPMDPAIVSCEVRLPAEESVEDASLTIGGEP